MTDSAEPSVLRALAAVEVRPDPAFTQELVARLREPPSQRPLVVTDLIDLRRAFFRRRQPVAMPPERLERVESGRELHFATAALLSPARFHEVRVSRDGIVGQIDLLADRPVEIKTTSRLPSVSELPRARPAYFEQLGMYCALVDQSVGRLVTVEVDDGERPARARVFDCRFASLSSVREEMRSRAERLRAALGEGRANALPRCPWFEVGCEFRAARVCDCRGDEPAAPAAIADQVEGLAEDEPAGRALTEALTRGEGARQVPVARRFRDLIYPRRAFFERTNPLPADEAPAPAAPVSSPELYRQVQEILESGGWPVDRRSPESGEPLERVVLADERPVLVRTSRGWRHLTPREVVRDRPQYLMELGLRAQAVRRPVTSLVVGYERATDPADRVEAFRAEFTDLGLWAEVARARSEALAAALHSGDPRPLPPCPRWMYDTCPYRALCHCGPDAEERRQP